MTIRPLASVALAISVVGLASFASAQTVRESVAVDVISLRVTARDASGRRVEDLKPGDLVLTVDGRPVAIETFTGPRGNPAGSLSSKKDALTPLDSEPAGSEGRRTRTIILVSEGETQPFDRKLVCDELDKYLQTSGSTRGEFLVARFDGTRLGVESRWTGDPAVARAAVRRIADHPAINRVASPAGVAGDTRFTSASWIQLLSGRLHKALLETLATFPNDRSERRLLIVSSGTALMAPTDLASILACRMTPSERTRLTKLAGTDVSAAHASEIERATFALWSRSVNPSGQEITMSDVVAKALEREVAVIPVRAEAMDRGDMNLAVRGMTVPQAGGIGSTCPVALASTGVLTPQLIVGQTLTQIAENTGADPILVPGRTAAGLEEIGFRAVYTLSFRDPVGDHRYHQIALSSGRPGVRVDYRRGYRIPMEDERTLDAVVAGFLQPEGRSDPMGAAITQSAAVGEKAHAATRLEIAYAPPLETGAGSERKVDVIAVGEDANGNRTEPIQWTGTAHQADEAGGFQAAVLLGVAPTYAWSVAVRDQPTGLTSYVLVPAIDAR